LLAESGRPAARSRQGACGSRNEPWPEWAIHYRGRLRRYSLMSEVAEERYPTSRLTAAETLCRSEAQRLAEALVT
jgi:hypothetical protein